MAESRFYTTDPADPDAPVLIDEYNGLKPGMTVEYAYDLLLPGPFVITELLRWDHPGVAHAVQAILDDGAFEVDADNLRPVTS